MNAENDGKINLSQNNRYYKQRNILNPYFLIWTYCLAADDRLMLNNISGYFRDNGL